MDKICSITGDESTDPKLVRFHETRDKIAKVVCLNDNVHGHGFGRILNKGDTVEIHGTIHNHLGFCVSVPSECAFYPYNDFELVDQEETVQ